MRYLILFQFILFIHLTYGQTQIYIPEPFGDNFIESELITELTVVPLQIERYGMITPDMEMKVDGDQYFILDNKRTQCVYHFGREGQLINTICEKKKENEAENLPILNNPAKFNLDPYNKQIEIYNFENSIIHRYGYDGVKTGQMKVEISPSDFVRDSHDNYWIYSGWNKIETQYRLLKTDINGKIIQRRMRLISKCTSTESYSFYVAGENICFWELLGNMCYMFEKNGIKPKYEFDFGIHNLPMNYHMMRGDDSYTMINQTGYYTVKKYIENHNFAYFFLNYSSVEQREMFHVIHDKKANQIHVYTENSAIGAFDKAQAITADDELLFLISPRKIRQLLSGGTEFIPASFMDIGDELRKLRNPVVLKMKLQSISDASIDNENENSDSLYFGN